jgi:hypothetical protein
VRLLRNIGLDGLAAVLLVIVALRYGLDPRLLNPAVVNQKLPAGQVGVEAVDVLPVVLWWAASAFMIAAVAVRSRLPLLALAVATAGQVVHLGFTPFLDNAVDLAPALALYTVAARTGRRAVSIIAAAAAAGAAAGRRLAGRRDSPHPAAVRRGGAGPGPGPAAAPGAGG